MDVIPGEAELSQKVVSAVRGMPKVGDLINPHNYLDILFRLLQEDAISDLRSGVLLLRSLESYSLTRQQKKSKIRETNLKLHEYLTIDGVDVIEGLGCLQFRLPVDKKRFVDWKICKKLLPGSLVILSIDSFSTLLVGVLLNCDSKQRNETHKKSGYVTVNVQPLKASFGLPSLYELSERYRMNTFSMIESTAYFESYRHVLEQLKIMIKWDEMPL
jgi:hypothetical protein